MSRERTHQTLILSVTTLIVLLLLLLPPEAMNGLPLGADLKDAMHLPLFAVVTLVFFHYLPLSSGSFRRRLAITAGLTVLLAGVSEGAQHWVGRNPSYLDSIRDLAGIGLVLAGLAVRRRLQPLLRYGVFVSLLLVGVMVMFYPFWYEWRLDRWQQTHFPILGDFEDAIELRVWYARQPQQVGGTQLFRSQEHASSGDYSLRVEIGDEPWPSVRTQFGHADWRGYDALAIDVYNPAESFGFHIRIDDDQDCSKGANRFNRRIPVASGWNRLTFPMDEILHGPKERELNLAAIHQLILFIKSSSETRVFYMDYVRLIPSRS